MSTAKYGNEAVQKWAQALTTMTGFVGEAIADGHRCRLSDFDVLIFFRSRVNRRFHFGKIFGPLTILARNSPSVCIHETCSVPGALTQMAINLSP